MPKTETRKARRVSPVPELTPAQARMLHLAAQGLLHTPRAKPTPQTLVQAIRRMQLLQIDTIHVVARSPYLVLFSRLGPYPMAWLDELLAAGELAECWAHEACFVVARDIPLHRAAMPLRQGHWAMRRARRMLAEHAGEMQQLLDHVRTRGPVRSTDFQRHRRGAGGWWDWKPEKRWLEALFALGELMVSRRENFQRVYDVSGRVRASHAPGPTPASSAQARRWMLARSVYALGIAKAHWIADYFRLARVTRDELDALCADGELVRVEVRGWERPAYVHHDHADLLARAAAGRLRATRTTLLSPFDPVVWDRRRARELFGFDYALECYVPAPRRRYGYFVLPILHRGRLVGRLDAKAHRRAGVFEIRSLHMQPGIGMSEGLAAALARAVAQCAHWHGTPVVDSGKGTARLWAKHLEAWVPARH